MLEKPSGGLPGERAHGRRGSTTSHTDEAEPLPPGIVVTWSTLTAASSGPRCPSARAMRPGVVPRTRGAKRPWLGKNPYVLGAGRREKAEGALTRLAAARWATRPTSGTARPSVRSRAQRRSTRATPSVAARLPMARARPMATRRPETDPRRPSIKLLN
jgi:hypothetical protein